ncbi:hypothetical protein AKI39_00350 [Bordetella sp. H567]|uniref:PhaM family polyhydroxyalkanoate granule multifunctional regulatory protein n=1 Tax=Bordetella sp. H567 TaxID=1697043 RepID=UPI00081CC828|nr:PhaM family polyhydroxyalkanoate granule multifunctional regulatory protein [Bordetella sp. H567]AOB29447.1 hypothetical protein AKI39_00350 [Bordetella sp. H567]
MTDQNSNPFVLPGMGQASGDAAGNPLLASMEMMRQAWAGLTGPGGLAQVMPMTPPMNLQELERRIAELRAVESWLRMNLSMLSSTIQGMEVQRSTIATLRSFVDNLGAQAQDPASWGDASPLEVVLGLKPAPGRSGAAAGGQARDARSAADIPPEPQARSWGGAGADAREPGVDTGARAAGARQDAAAAPPEPEGQAGAGVPSSGSAQAMSQAAQSASEAWWGMLQQQFNQLAAATAASMPGGAQGAGSAQQGASTSGAAPGGAATQEHPHAGPANRHGASQPAASASGSASGKKNATAAHRATSRKTAVKKNKIQSDPDQS